MSNHSNHVTNLYAVKDILVGVCLPPFTGDSDAGVIRQFGDAITSNKTPLSEHPADYVLLKIGSVDLESGTLVDSENVLLCHGNDFIKTEVK